MDRVKHKLTDFYGVERSMTRTEAYKSLPLQPFRLLHAMLEQHDGTNNGQIGMTVDQACSEIGCSRTIAIGALKELRVRGLVIRTHKADRTAPGRRIKGDHSTFLLTCFPYLSESGEVVPPPRDFLRWKPGMSMEFLEDEIGLRPLKEARLAEIEAARPKVEPDMSWAEGVAF